MKIETPATLADAVEGQQVLKFEGTVKSVYRATAGSNEHGDYHLQNIVVETEGKSIKLKLDGQPPLADEDKGRTITCEAVQTEKKGGGKQWSGLLLVSETYKGEKSLVLKVTKCANVIVGGNAKGKPAGNKATGQPAASKPPAEQRPKNPIGDMKRYLARRMNAEHELLIASGIVAAAYKARTGTDLSPDQLHGMVGRWAIQMERDGIVAALEPKLLPELAAAAAASSAS